MFWKRPLRPRPGLVGLTALAVLALLAGCGDDAVGPDSADRVPGAGEEGTVSRGSGTITVHHYWNVTMDPGHMVVPEGQHGSTLIASTGVVFLGRGGISPECPYDDTYTLGQFLPTPEEHAMKFDRYFYQIAYEGASATFDLGCRNDYLYIALTQDHGPYPEEALEYEVGISNNPDGPFRILPDWTPITIFRGGWSTDGEFSGDCDGNGSLNDDYSVLWDLPGKVRYVQITPLEPTGPYNEPEIDAVMGMNHMPRRIHFDVLPTECPNEIDVMRRPTMTVAILGTRDFDVTKIDVSTVEIAGALPLRTGFFDVAAPMVDGVEGDCTTAGPDGYEDLVLEFQVMDIVNCLGGVHEEDESVRLIIRGNRTDRKYFYGTDRVAIHGTPECLLGRD